ncbi:hypothetical protein [Psychroserpens ponticola]|uniref:DUF975 family protein n=1 Tax=Psychroserpens ponticola TaxID=2932268 RepID=A0ABY7S017_9FLAO|nr:hypothetical protein [Psychroserpens ponticola]WCO02271.1 hypothetical protein MUN68_001985 [Psychroserpens ponticola]
MAFQNIQNKIKSSQKLDFGNILDLSIKLFKEVWLKGVLMILITMVFGGVIAILFVSIGLIPNPYDVAGSEALNLTTYYAKSAFNNLPQTIVVSPVVFGMLAGFYRICKQVDLKESQDDDIFYFFKGDNVRKVLMLGLIYSIIATVAQALFLLPYIYVFIPLSFFAVVFAHNPELSETEIVKLSFSLGNKKWFLTFGLMFITGILGMLGIIACGIGVIFTISIVYLPVYFIYREVVGFEDHDEIKYIGSE